LQSVWLLCLSLAGEGRSDNQQGRLLSSPSLQHLTTSVHKHSFRGKHDAGWGASNVSYFMSVTKNSLLGGNLSASLIPLDLLLMLDEFQKKLAHFTLHQQAKNNVLVTAIARTLA